MVMANFIEEDYHNKLREFRKDWIKNNKCECVKNLLPNRVINCKHINAAIEIQFKERKDLLWNMAMEELQSDCTDDGLKDYLERCKL